MANKKDASEYLLAANEDSEGLQSATTAPLETLHVAVKRDTIGEYYWYALEHCFTVLFGGH